MTALFGYNGKILHVDLGSRTSTVEEPDERFWRTYAGGGLLAAHYLLKETPAGIDAFDPRNLLILTSSVVAGQPYAALARFTAAAKSPLTGGIGEALSEGPFGAALKRSGYDAIIVRGAATGPLRIAIDDGVVSFHDASDLWGLSVQKTEDRLEGLLPADSVSATIGPAGENRVRFASIVSGRAYQAARLGLGAVMGSKRLKAISITGGTLPPVADPAKCAAMTESYRQRMVDNPLTRWQLNPPGFADWVELHGIDAALCTYNYRDTAFDHVSAYSTAEFMRHYRHDGVCPGCPNACIKFFGAGDDATYDPRAGGIHQEITGAMGPNLGLTKLEDVLKANILCNDLGLDPDSLGFTLSMAMECVDVGLLSEGDAEGLRFGAGEAVLDLIPRIATRSGFGAVLAEGSLRAARQIGGEAERFAMQVKGLEMVPFEPRSQTNLALGYAVAPFGPRYIVCEHDWDYDPEVGWEHTLEHSRTLGILEWIGMGHLGPDKVRHFKVLSTVWSAADVLDMSTFAVAPTRVFSLHEMAELLAAVTGWNTSSYEIMRYGERRMHLMRAYNLREGLGAADDTLPARFFDEPVPVGPWQGATLDRATFGECIRTYYRMMGWNDQGVPLKETLLDQNVAWVADQLNLA